MDAELRARIEQYVHRAVRPRNIDTGALCQPKHVLGLFSSQDVLSTKAIAADGAFSDATEIKGTLTFDSVGDLGVALG
jgi:hypothetical protein